jgi:hypothetical protein
MPTRAYYQQQARVLFELAAKMSLKADAERLIRLPPRRTAFPNSFISPSLI